MANGSNIPWPYMDAILYQCGIQNYSIVCAKRIENCGSEIKIKSFIVEPSHKTLNLRNINGYQRISTRLSIDPLKTVPLHQYDWTHQSKPNHQRPQGLHFFHGWRSGTPLFFCGDCNWLGLSKPLLSGRSWNKKIGSQNYLYLETY